MSIYNMLVEFDGRVFNTKKAFELYVRNQLYNEIGFGYYETGSTHFSFLYKLFERHPFFEYHSSGDNKIKGFLLEENLLCRNAIHMSFVRQCGEHVAFSWRKCITPIVKSVADRNKERLILAMRETISPDTMAFKKNAIPSCKLCGSTANLHTDHSDISFKKISTDYLVLCVSSGVQAPQTFECDLGTCMPRFRVQDSEFATSWYEYHKKIAVYQILCKTCNCKKGDK
jgi:hypothetical protein